MAALIESLRWNVYLSLTHVQDSSCSLRCGLDVIPSAETNRPGLLLRDPLRYTDKVNLRSSAVDARFALPGRRAHGTRHPRSAYPGDGHVGLQRRGAGVCRHLVGAGLSGDRRVPPAPRPETGRVPRKQRALAGPRRTGVPGQRFGGAQHIQGIFRYGDGTRWLLVERSRCRGTRWLSANTSQ